MYYFIDALKNYVNFKGRASRKDFWMFFLFYIIFSFLLGVTAGIIAIVTKFQDIINYVKYGYAVVFLLPYLAVYVRRIHDSNKSGWFILVPIYNIILLFIRGTDGENNYGQKPTSRQDLKTEKLSSIIQ